MNPWEMFCHLCKEVVEGDGDVFLDVLIIGNIVEMGLFPYNPEEWEDESDD